jgi:hypothetical protein
MGGDKMNVITLEKSKKQELYDFFKRLEKTEKSYPFTSTESKILKKVFLQLGHVIDHWLLLYDKEGNVSLAEGIDNKDYYKHLDYF